MKKRNIYETAFSGSSRLSPMGGCFLLDFGMMGRFLVLKQDMIPVRERNKNKECMGNVERAKATILEQIPSRLAFSGSMYATSGSNSNLVKLIREARSCGFGATEFSIPRNFITYCSDLDKDPDTI